MILNTGSRTDIPAYYSEWFYNRIKEGYVYTRNPYNPKLIHSYQLNPSVVDILVFCTKNPEPMMKRLDEISYFKQFWGITLTAYGKDIEPNVLNKHRVIECIKILSDRFGSKSVEWRYDPIFLSDKYTKEVHLRSFEHIAKELSGSITTCVVSFIDLYQKTLKNFPSVKEVNLEDQIELIKAFVEIGTKYNIRIKTCLENKILENYGVDTSGCLTQSVLEKALNQRLNVPKQTQAREGCECLLGNDIGAYNSCGHGCVYCYANYDMSLVKENMMKHNKNSPLLIGELKCDDIIREMNQVSYINNQLSLF